MTASLLRRVCFVMTDAVPVFFVSASGVSVQVYCLTGVIRWHVTSIVMSLMWPLAPPPKVLGTYWVFALALG